MPAGRPLVFIPRRLVLRERLTVEAAGRVFFGEDSLAEAISSSASRNRFGPTHVSLVLSNVILLCVKSVLLHNTWSG